MKILAIDPGTTRSGHVMMDEGYRVTAPGDDGNDAVLAIALGEEYDVLAIECMEPRYSGEAGGRIGAETYETCYMIGKLMRAAEGRGKRVERVYRREERQALIPTKKNGLPPLPAWAGKTLDSRIRAALVMRFAQHDRKAGKGTKDRPDWFYGVTGDAWMACAVGVTALDRRKRGGDSADEAD